MNNMTHISSSLPPQTLPDQRAPPPVKAGRPAPVSSPEVRANQAQANQAQPNQAQPSAREMKRISDDLQRRVSAAAPELKFSIDQSSGRSIIKITDPTTNEVIRQIPTEEALELNESLERFQQGLLLNSKA
jgi:flagellar protein FlaG